MPHQRHGRRHTVVSYDTGVKPPKPGVSRYGLIDFTLPTPSPAKSYPLSVMIELLCAVGVVPTRVLPEVGAYLRVSGPLGPLTSVYLILSARRLTAMMCLVTTFIIKSDVVLALRAGAAALFSYGGGALWFQFCAGLGFFGGCI